MRRLPHNFKNLSGRKFGRLTVTSESISIEKNGKRVRKWLCSCSCGNDVYVPTNSLTKPNGTKSCGCLQKERTSKSNTIYKDKVDKKLRRVYSDILQRCYNRKATGYKHYGGRGIKVCNRWLESFKLFLEDMKGEYKEGLSIDRVDTNLGYSPENCKWVDRTCQAFNRNPFGESKYRGVSGGYKGKWRVRVILEGGEQVYLGQYHTEEQAAEVYNRYVVDNKLPNILNKVKIKENVTND